jgi:hypothetical protein
MYINEKLKPVETIPGMRGVKKNDRGSEFSCAIFDIRTFVNTTMCPQHNNKINKIK